MLVAGVMSGTSADGIDVALVRLLGRGFATRVQFVAHRSFRYPADVRRAVLAAMNAQSASVADLSRLHFLLGELYARAVEKTVAGSREKCALVGCHGQTIYHQGTPAPYLKHKIATTWQIGEAAVIARRLGVPVVSDFRPADIAAGGHGAPLVPYFDYLLYRHRRRNRILQNVGGIANLTFIPAAAKPAQVVAFDTGPGNMVMDAIAERLFKVAFDRGGRLAGQGIPFDRVIGEVMRAHFFRRKPPKSAGREQFGREFVDWFIARCHTEAKRERRKRNDHDILATATALTARSIASSVRAVLGDNETRTDYLVSGGGARNRTLMAMIAAELASVKLTISAAERAGIPPQAKEAAAFAVLAYQTFKGEPSNVPSATGAKAPAILGKISYA